MPSTDASPRFLAGVHHGWHAVAAGSVHPGCEHAWSACGEIVRQAKVFPDDQETRETPRPYDPSEVPQSHDPCPACRWIVAARTGTLEAALVTLTDPLARDTAAAILNESSREALDDDDAPLDDPRMLQLLTAVSRHAPAELVSEGCAGGDCDHGDGECPSSPACQACSLQAQGWGGEWEGTFMGECTIPAPCAPLLALAGHYGVTAAGEATTP